MEVQELKIKLLATECFIDNEYLDKYCNLVINNVQLNTKFGCQLHHILQKSYFKHFNLSVDNSSENIVNLLYKDHCLAHWYLCNCTVTWLKKANNTAFRYMINQVAEKYSDYMDKEMYEELQKYYGQTLLHIDKTELANYYATHSLIETSKHFNTNKTTLINIINFHNLNKKNKYKKHSEINVQELIDYYLVQNHSYDETAAKFNISKSAIINIIKKNNSFKKQPYNKNHISLKDINSEEFLNYYNSHTRLETMEHFNINFCMVQRLCKDLNITKRFDHSLDKEIINFYKDHSVKETKNKFNISTTALFEILKGQNENNNKKS